MTDWKMALILATCAASVSVRSYGQGAQPFVVTIETTVSGGAFPTIDGATNLPDGSVLWVSLWPPFPACYGTCNPEYPDGDGGLEIAGREVRVKQGRFKAGPGWKTYWPRSDGRSGLHSGTYILEVRLIQFWSEDRQPPSVRAIIGTIGKYMRGPLVGGCCFGYGSPGRYGTQTDAQKVLADAKLMPFAQFGPDVYYARYVTVP